MSYNIDQDYEIQELKSRILELEDQVKILSNELQSVNRNEQKEKVCPHCLQIGCSYDVFFKQWKCQIIPH